MHFYFRFLNGVIFEMFIISRQNICSDFSFGWKNIWALKSLIDKGTRRILCSGQQMLVWSENWLPNVNPRPATSILTEINHLLKVSDCRWNLHLIRVAVSPSYFSLILSLKPPSRLSSDGYCWHYTNSGNYTIKSDYEVSRMTIHEDTRFLLHKPFFNPLKEYVRKIPAPNKLRHFIWQALSGDLAVNERLAHRHLRVSSCCLRRGHP